MPAQRPQTGRRGACRNSRQHGFVWCRLHCASPAPALMRRVAWKKLFPARTAMRQVKVLMDISSANWVGVRSHLSKRGVRLEFPYISDCRLNLKSEQPERFASWHRFRWTMDVDGALTGQHGVYFHTTALWQGGGNLGTYLGLLTSPRSMSSPTTCHLDSCWIEKRWFGERVTAHIGQFAGQNFCGAQHSAASFIPEAMGHAPGHLFTDFESFDPPSTPAMEVGMVHAQPIRVVDGRS
jgi:carbohydrate-selective porin OprB